MQFKSKLTKTINLIFLCLATHHVNPIGKTCVFTDKILKYYEIVGVHVPYVRIDKKAICGRAKAITSLARENLSSSRWQDCQLNKLRCGLREKKRWRKLHTKGRVASISSFVDASQDSSACPDKKPHIYAIGMFPRYFTYDYYLSSVLKLEKKKKRRSRLFHKFRNLSQIYSSQFKCEDARRRCRIKKSKMYF
ncbi:hypothetical protein PUN28_014828 [Cardiocondyla obscurior]|uniref:Uncharacterized protein n=1 Tax=Cardiocondyla obscurior TaxID=286306 RepID=A0AAW2F1N4_9HYME